MTKGKPTFGGKLMFPTEFLAAEDLGGKDVTVEIESVKPEVLRTTEGTADKFTVRFKGAKKRLVLNKTNAKLIAVATGECEARKWPGKRITLYGTHCQAFGETVTCIRVRETPPEQPETSADPQPDYLQKIAAAATSDDLDAILQAAARQLTEVEMVKVLDAATKRRPELGD